MVEVKITIDGKEMSYEEARRLYVELKEIFDPNPGYIGIWSPLQTKPSPMECSTDASGMAERLKFRTTSMI